MPIGYDGLGRVVTQTAADNTTNMTVGDVILDVADASKATGNITAGDVRLKAQTGCTVELGGTANDLTCEVYDSSLVKLEGFSVRNASIKMDGGSTMTRK